jgi:hypothetical protein
MLGRRRDEDGGKLTIRRYSGNGGDRGKVT